MREILKCIKFIDELDIELFNRLNIGVEIQDFTEPNLSEKERIKIVKDYKNAFKKLKGKKALHGPFLDLKPASPDNLIREVSYKRYLDTIDIATELEVDYLIFHSQINPYLNDPFIKNLNNSQAKEFWNHILANTSYKGTILIENIFEEEPSQIKDYMDIMDFPNLKLNLDIGHANLGKVHMDKWISELKDHIKYMHIHTNNGIHDQHLPPNSLDIKELYILLNKYGVEPVLSLEYKIDDIEEELKKYYC